MRTIFALIVLSFSLSAFARLSDSEQTAAVEKIAKGHRRQMYIQGHTEVESHTQKISKAQLDELMKTNPDTEQPLNSDEVSSLYRCLQSTKTCSLFLITLGGAMYGDRGVTHNYVLLDPNTGKATREIMQGIYSE